MCVDVVVKQLRQGSKGGDQLVTGPDKFFSVDFLLIARLLTVRPGVGDECLVMWQGSRAEHFFWPFCKCSLAKPLAVCVCAAVGCVLLITPRPHA